MGAVKIIGAVPDERVVTFINHLVQKYPLDRDTIFQFDDSVNFTYEGCPCKGLAYPRSNRARVATRWPVKEVIYYVAHEYKHLLQAHAGATFNKSEIRQMEDDASNFGLRERKAAIEEGIIEFT